MGITIKDIAKIAGVSYSTVSKALNDSPLVKNDTKKKIVEIANELGYEPNFAAQRLVSKQTKIIGLIWPTIERVVLSTLVTKINNEINQTPYSMILSVEPIENALDTFRRFQVDGIILFEENSEPSKNQTNIPLISYGVAKNRTVQYPIIDANHEQAMYKAVNHLYELGHRDFAYIGDLSSTDPMQKEKFDGFMMAMQQHKLAIEEINKIDTAGLDWFNGYAATKKRLDDSAPPTAIVGGSYDISNGIIRGIKETGLRIPHDVSIISYDNIPQMANTEIPLTSIGVPIEKLAKEIVHSIIQLIEDENITSTVKKMLPILVERESCARRK